jgi:hypothetical protein
LLLFLVLVLGCSEGGQQESDGSRGSEYGGLREFKERAVSEYRERRSTSGSVSSARSATVAWILRQEGVHAAGVAEDGETIWILMENGVELDFIAQ